MDLIGILLIFTWIQVPVKGHQCFQGNFPAPLSHATVTCTGGNVTCSVTCDVNHVFDDGNTTIVYSCTGENNWTPTLPPKSCLKYENPEFRVMLTVRYITSIPAQMCVTAHREGLKSHNATLNTDLTSYCNVQPIIEIDNIVVRETSVVVRTFELTTTITAAIFGPNVNKIACVNSFFGLGYSALQASLLYATSLVCDGNNTSTLRRGAMTVDNFGNLCFGGSQLHVTTFGEQCVKCPPGTFLSSDNCTACADGTYQEMNGKINCKTCPVNLVPSDDKTYCIDQCPPGNFLSNGKCTACTDGTYQDLAGRILCKTCPDNTVPSDDKTYCKAECEHGKYGINCLRTCDNCLDGGCSTESGICLKGCITGWTGPSCSLPTGNQLITVVVVLSVALVIVIGLNVLVIIKPGLFPCRQANNNSRNQSRKDTDTQHSNQESTEKHENHYMSCDSVVIDAENHHTYLSIRTEGHQH